MRRPRLLVVARSCMLSSSSIWIIFRSKSRPGIVFGPVVTAYGPDHVCGVLYVVHVVYNRVICGDAGGEFGWQSLIFESQCWDFDQILTQIQTLEVPDSLVYARYTLNTSNNNVQKLFAEEVIATLPNVTIFASSVVNNIRFDANIQHDRAEGKTYHKGRAEVIWRILILTFRFNNQLISSNYLDHKF